MYLTFKSEGHETRTFTKNLIKSEYVNKSDIPQTSKELFRTNWSRWNRTFNAYRES